MGNFDNVTLGPVIVDVNGQTLGYCKESSWSVNPSFLELKDLMPRVFVGKQLTDFRSELTIKALELTAQNQLFAMGIDEDALTNVSSSNVETYYKNISLWELGTAYATNAYVEPATLTGRCYLCIAGGTSHATVIPSFPATTGSTVSDGTCIWQAATYGGEAVTMAGYKDCGETSTSLYKLDLTGYNIQSTAYVDVYNSGYTAKYTIQTDYYIDLMRGILLRDKAGTMATSGTYGVVYKYSAITQQRINYKPEDFDLETVDVSLVHENNSTGKKIRVDMFDGQGSGAEFTTGSDDWNGFNIKVEGTDNTNRASNRLGRIQIES
jgi:hypothetical protein